MRKIRRAKRNYEAFYEVRETTKFEDTRFLEGPREKELDDLLQTPAPDFHGQVIASRSELEYLWAEWSSRHTDATGKVETLDLSGADLSQVELSGVILERFRLDDVTLVNEDEKREIDEKRALAASGQSKSPYAGTVITRRNQLLYIAKVENWYRELNFQPDSPALLNGIDGRGGRFAGSELSGAG